ncbi:dentin sialophosphoprotein isoform X2 [Uranotaenia lowii]|uniref:dentin sialophosphoprotein isoform X2 n=1 Tax=Uranotaenia lowii TaxID=190385 RepID=UPI00247B0E4A|nr:dentin sialophosphoprotein isoform X2 [Uranotaenia lowii]XP_055613850.1 dentin sialophosphoprotein isoform X2 [Uranotaenia lowii]
MSRLFANTAYLDDANGNTVLAKPVEVSVLAGVAVEEPSKSSSSSVAAGSNIDQQHQILASGETLIIHSPSNDDLSQSLSEYTDADESLSAPTELLAEFLSAVMLRDYVNALKYCKLILQYEPHNATARDFYPHILSKIALGEAASSNSVHHQHQQLHSPTGDQHSGESDENYNFAYHNASSSTDDSDDIEVVMVCSSDSDHSDSNCSSFLDYSNEEDEEDDGDDGAAVEGNGQDAASEDSRSSSRSSSSNSDDNGEVNFGDAEDQINCNSTEESDQMPPSQSATDNNTSHSYSSLLLEEEEKDLTLSDISNLNIEDDENADDSGESPAQPYTSHPQSQHNSMPDQQQQPNHQDAQPVKPQPNSTQPLASKLVALLRSKVIPSKTMNND